MNTLKKQYLFHSSQLNINKKDINMSKGFSLVEIMVVIAILAVMVAVLVPSFLSYVEKSRAQKDASATGELTNAVRLALADSNIYDEVCAFSTKGNISCYIDKEVESGYEKYKVEVDGPKKSYSFSDNARISTETPYYGAGDMTGVTLTFTPVANPSSTTMQYHLKDGVINKFAGSTKTTGGELPKLTNRTVSILSEKMNQVSDTYRNSDFTVFIKLNSIGGQKENTASVYGQYNGTNLNEPVKDIFLTGDRNASGVPNPNKPESGNPDGNNGAGSTKPDSGGSGSITTPDPDKPSEIQKPQADLEAKMSHAKYRENCINLTGTITFSLNKAPTSGGIDISEAGNGSVIAVIEGQNATIYGKNGGGVICPNSVRNIGIFAHSKANDFQLDGLDTSAMTDMYSMFSQCVNIKTLNLNNFETQKVTTMRSMFFDCVSLTELDLSSFDTSNVKDMGWMFANCKTLTNLNVKSFDTSKVIDMYVMFQGCTSLKSLDVSNFNTSSVTSMRGMFEECRSLTSLNLNNFDTSKVVYMSSMFNNCRALTNLDISNFNTSQVTMMNNMFSSCWALKTLDVSSFDTSKVTNMYYMFASNSSLEKLDLSNFNTSNVTTMQGMFYYDQALTTVNLSSFDTSNVKTMSAMFTQCLSLVKLDLSHFDTLNVTNMNSMFSNCSSMKEINMKNCDTSNVKDMNWMFGNCKSLITLNVKPLDTSKVTDFTYMFINCNSLTTVLCKTQSDVERLKNIPRTPSTINFIVK